MDLDKYGRNEKNSRFPDYDELLCGLLCSPLKRYIPFSALVELSLHRKYWKLLLATKFVEFFTKIHPDLFPAYCPVENLQQITVDSTFSIQLGQIRLIFDRMTEMNR